MQKTKRKHLNFLHQKSIGSIIFDIFNYLFLIFFCLTIVYPFWSTLLLSFSNISEATSLGFHIWIKSWNTGAYRFALFKYGDVLIAYVNSIIRTIVGTVLTLIVTLLAAYPLSKKNLPGRNVFTIYFLISMFFSGGLIPTYLLMRNIGLIDTRWALIFPVLVRAYFIVIMRNFLMTIDNAYEESAFIDGANYLQILVKIIVPLSKPILATIALWTAVLHWNSWFDALIYIRSDSKIVLQLLLRRMIQEITIALQQGLQQFRDLEEVELPSQSVRAAITILTIGPIIFIYPFLQKYFIKGIFIGSLKG